MQVQHHISVTGQTHQHAAHTLKFSSRVKFIDLLQHGLAYHARVAIGVSGQPRFNAVSDAGIHRRIVSVKILASRHFEAPNLAVKQSLR